MVQRKKMMVHTPHFPTNKTEKKIIRDTIPKMPFREARRHKISLYNALLLEVWEDMYPTTARRMEQLISYENRLMEGMFIKERVENYPRLLLNLYDHSRTVERITRENNVDNEVKILRLMNECILLLKPYRKIFGWLLLECYNISIQHCEELGELQHESANEQKCLLYFNYGVYLMEVGVIDEAMKHFKYAMSLTNLHFWFCRNIITLRSISMYLQIVQNMAIGILNHCDELLSTNPVKLVEYTSECINYLIQNLNVNMSNIMKMHVVIVQALLEINDLKEAQRRVESVRHLMTQYNNKNAFVLEYEVKYLYLAGRVAYESGSAQEALVIFKKGEILSRQLEKNNLEGILLFEIGRLQACHITMRRLSLETLEKAQRIIRSNSPDAKELQIIHYIKAIARMRLIYPLLIDSFRRSERFSIDFYNLCHWKNSCHPFWRDLRQQYVATQGDELCYLMDERKNIK